MTVLDYVLIHASLGSFALAGGLGIECVRRGRAGLLVLARIALGAGILLSLAGLLRRGLALDSFPVASLHDMLLCSGAIIAALALSIDLSRSLPMLTLGAAPLSFLAVLAAALLGAPSAETEVRSAWTGLHILIMLLAYGGFALSFLGAILYLIQLRQLKSHSQASVLGIMPSLETLRRLIVRSLAGGVAAMTAGILVGYLYGRSLSLPPGWRVDAKIWGTTLSWALYLVVFILSFVPAFKGRRTAVASVASFVIVMATFWFAAFLSNFHRFL